MVTQIRLVVEGVGVEGDMAKITQEKKRLLFVLKPS